MCPVLQALDALGLYFRTVRRRSVRSLGYYFSVLQLLLIHRPVAHPHARPLIRAVDRDLSHRRMSGCSGAGRQRPRLTTVSSAVRAPPEFTVMRSVIDVARRCMQVGVIHDIRRGLTHRQHQILDSSIRPMRHEHWRSRSRIEDSAAGCATSVSCDYASRLVLVDGGVDGFRPASRGRGQPRQLLRHRNRVAEGIDRNLFVP
jgi:hypothetical protein